MSYEISIDSIDSISVRNYMKISGWFEPNQKVMRINSNNYFLGYNTNSDLVIVNTLWKAISVLQG